MKKLRTTDLLVGDGIITEDNHVWIVFKTESNVKSIVCIELEEYFPYIDYIDSLIKETYIKTNRINKVLRPISKDDYFSNDINKYNVIYDYTKKDNLKDKSKKLKSLAKEMIKLLKDIDK